MLSVCGPLPPPPLLEPLLVPLQPAIPAATQANRTKPAAAYPIRLPIDKRRCIAKNATSSTETMPPTGSVGSCGRARGCARGINSDRAVVNVAVQEASPVAAPDVGVQGAAAPKLFDPFFNFRVPVAPMPVREMRNKSLLLPLPP